jgi:hypothetical protein
MARGGHGLPKVLPGPAMPYPSTPCGRAACGRLLPFWTPHAVRLCRQELSVQLEQNLKGIFGHANLPLPSHALRPVGDQPLPNEIRLLIY